MDSGSENRGLDLEKELTCSVSRELLKLPNPQNRPYPAKLYRAGLEAAFVSRGIVYSF